MINQHPIFLGGERKLLTHLINTTQKSLSFINNKKHKIGQKMSSL